MITETSLSYNVNNSCKYRLPCGWCDRKNCLCTYSFTTTLYATASNATSSSESLSSSVKSNVKVGSEDNGFINTTESFIKG